MDWAQLESDFRRRTGDITKPYLFTPDDVLQWLKEAEEEAVIRGRLLMETQNEAVCKVMLRPGIATYQLHPSLYEITRISLGDCMSSVKLVTRVWLDEMRPDWRTETDAPVRFAVQDERSIQLVPTPTQVESLMLEGYRLPLDESRNEPEIHPANHRFLVYWAIFRAFSTPDPETMDLGSAELWESRFTRHFGLRPDSDLRRSTQQDTEHHNTLW